MWSVSNGLVAIFASTTLHQSLTTKLTVSQFTLLASTKKGNKPDFHKSAKPAAAKELYDQFFNKMQSLYSVDRVKDGVFQAMMDVALINDGPVGVDYCCEFGAVKPQRAFSITFVQGANIILQVTIEIDTNPPPMDNPTSLGDLPSDGETIKGKIQQQFVLPASLLE